MTEVQDVQGGIFKVRNGSGQLVIAQVQQLETR